MRNQITQSIGKTFRIFLLITGIQICAFGQYGESGQLKEQKLAGTWQTSVTPVNCLTGDPVAPAFPGILTFHWGGTMTGTSTAVSSAYGVWEKILSRGNYSFAFISQRQSSTGAFIGTQIVRQTAIFEGSNDEFSSTGSVEILDANGNPVGMGCSIATGIRFE